MGNKKLTDEVEEESPFVPRADERIIEIKDFDQFAQCFMKQHTSS